MSLIRQAVIAGCLTCILTSLLAGPVAAVDCWVEDRLEPIDPALVRVAPVAAWKRDFAAASALLKRVPALNAAAGVRGRVSSFLGVGGELGPGNRASVRATLYPPRTWQLDCGLIAGSEVSNSGNVHITFNQPGDIFFEWAKALDMDGPVYPEPKVRAQVGSEVLYENGIVVLLPEGVAPWIPLTMDEYLAFRESEARELVASAERTLPESRANLEASRRVLAEVLEHRWRLTAAERESPVYWGPGQFGLPEPGGSRKGPLVRLNPAIMTGDSARRVHCIVVYSFAKDQAYRDSLAQAVREVDYAALRLLLR